ncbi:MAG: DNA polymerase III subunit epsilon [Pseudomonadota bacterium]|nr:DNA polymerase III subunit epsilon [Pseudomonadota bacterium]
MRQVVVDTETTGLEPERGHRVIEIGCVEIRDRRVTGEQFHQYVNPKREIDDAAYEIHGLSNRDLDDKPEFAAIADEFMTFIRGAELIIHNAPFDVEFLNYELSRMESTECIDDVCEVLDSLALARHKHPGQKNSLDALCRRYGIDSSAREQHGALLDAEILADLYLTMTGGQTLMFDDSGSESGRTAAKATEVRLNARSSKLLVQRPTPEELEAHEAYLDNLDNVAQEGSVWRQLLTTEESTEPPSNP